MNPYVCVLSGYLLLSLTVSVARGQERVAWPEGKQVAVSLSFADGRESQVEVGLGVLAWYGAQATFYVVPSAVERRPEGWTRAVQAGHEIGNHSLVHPCTGNFAWSRAQALEDYTLERMRGELTEANERIRALLGVEPVSFAYPCGQSFVGRGRETQSYVTVVAELFESGRGWMGEAPNDPAFVDPAQVIGVPMDGLSFEEVRRLVESARAQGLWLVLAGHDIGAEGVQTTRVQTLERFLQWAQDPENGLWLAPVGTVAAYLRGVD